MWQTRGAESGVSPLEPVAPLLVCVNVGVSDCVSGTRV